MKSRRVEEEHLYRCTIDRNVHEAPVLLDPPAGQPKPDLPPRLWRDERIKLHDEVLRATHLHDFEEIWRCYHGEGIKVAVLDSGLDKGHPAFPEEAILLRRRILNDELADGPDAVADDNGHGTHCAGIIAARPLKRLGDAGRERWVPFAPDAGEVHAPDEDQEQEVPPTLWRPSDPALAEHACERKQLDMPYAGLAPLVRLMIYKIADSKGNARLVDMAYALYDAVNEGADIVSLSVGSEKSADLLYGAVQHVFNHGRVLICSAGNRGRLSEINIGFPARYGGVITVAAHSRFGQPSGFSSVGGEIDMSAPGEDIWSAWIGGGYAKQSGTSMAAPFVAGLAALIWSKHRRFAAGTRYYRRDRPHTEPLPAEPNDTPIRNAEEMREHLLLMAAHRGYYDPLSGYGPLSPANYFAKQT